MPEKLPRPDQTSYLGQPGIDYALFSLAPGSPSLIVYGLDAATVFFTDFSGAFALYADSLSLGLHFTPPGAPFAGENVDALDVTHPCDPPRISTSFPLNGTGLNRDILTSSKIAVGGSWDTTITPQAGRGAGAWILYLRGAPAGPFAVDVGIALGLAPAGPSELLVDLSAVIADFTPPPHAGGGLPIGFSVPVPLHCPLIGVNWFAQAIVLGNLPAAPGIFDPWFSTAAWGTIGTF